MNLQTDFTQNISRQQLFHPKDRLLLAVSGGVDSVVLCQLCAASGYHFTIAHCNFQLRAGENEQEEALIKKMGIRYGVQTLVRQFDTTGYAKQHKVSVQVAARELRYRWFDELLTEHKYGKWLLTAHHLDDNIETLLMNFFKGTGIAGLRGMAALHGNIVRPLLFAGKKDLLSYAKAEQLDWLDDSSNATDHYTRNYFRHQVIPVIEKVYPEAASNLSHNLERFRDIETLYQQAVDGHKKNLLVQQGNEWHIPVLKLKKSVPLHTILYELTREFGFHPAQIQEIIPLLDSETGRYVASSTHRIIRNRKWLIIAPVENAAADHLLIEYIPAILPFPGGELKIEKSTSDISPVNEMPTIANIDAGELKFPLMLRKWKAGDYFYPLGMKKKKKVARFLIDLKLSKTEKEKVWVLEMDRKIIWVVGHRIDDRFKLRSQTREAIRISVSG